MYVYTIYVYMYKDVCMYIIYIYFTHIFQESRDFTFDPGASFPARWLRGDRSLQATDRSRIET